MLAFLRGWIGPSEPSRGRLPRSGELPGDKHKVLLKKTLRRSTKTLLDLTPVRIRQEHGPNCLACKDLQSIHLKRGQSHYNRHPDKSVRGSRQTTREPSICGRSSHDTAARQPCPQSCGAAVPGSPAGPKNVVMASPYSWHSDSASPPRYTVPRRPLGKKVHTDKVAGLANVRRFGRESDPAVSRPGTVSSPFYVKLSSMKSSHISCLQCANSKCPLLVGGQIATGNSFCTEKAMPLDTFAAHSLSVALA